MLNETVYSMDTPEQVEVDFDLAGPGSRFCAVVIDYLMIVLLIVALIVVAMIVGFSIGPIFDGRPERVFGKWAIAIIIALIFVITTGYFIIAEGLMAGQTPGKRSLKLRTLRDDGTPITWLDSLIRNLVRIVDFLPVFYGVGGVVCLFHPQHKRLGDLAAGTIVVKEGELDYRASTDRKMVSARPERTIENAELTASERQAIKSFMSRRHQLLPEARANLSMRLAMRLHERYGGELDDPERYLDRIARNEHHAR